jgi:hypothetical protein
VGRHSNQRQTMWETRRALTDGRKTKVDKARNTLMNAVRFGLKSGRASAEAARGIDAKDAKKSRRSMVSPTSSKESKSSKDSKSSKPRGSGGAVGLPRRSRVSLSALMTGNEEHVCY